MKKEITTSDKMKVLFDNGIKVTADFESPSRWYILTLDEFNIISKEGRIKGSKFFSGKALEKAKLDTLDFWYNKLTSKIKGNEI